MEVDGITLEDYLALPTGGAIHFHSESESMWSLPRCPPARGRAGACFFAGLDEHCGGVRGPDGEIPKPGEHVWV